jgi:F-type H+-transporting ATPase subunit b
MEILREPELWVGLGFVLAIALLVWKGAGRTIAKMLDARAAVISAELQEARRLREEAERLFADYRTRAESAEREVESILAEARAEVQRLAELARGDLNAQIARRLQAAQDKIGQAEAAAMTEIRGRAADAAVATAQKLIQARMDGERAGRLIQESIKDLGGKLN